jgi:hypothetical protein
MKPVANLTAEVTTIIGMQADDLLYATLKPVCEYREIEHRLSSWCSIARLERHSIRRMFYFFPIFCVATAL